MSGKVLESEELWALWELKCLACALDTEGHVRCGFVRNRDRLRSHISFLISNTNLDWIEEVQRLLIIKSFVYQDPRDGCYYVGLSPNQIRIILPKLLPHLIIKKEEAEEVLSWLEQHKK